MARRIWRWDGRGFVPRPPGRDDEAFFETVADLATAGEILDLPPLWDHHGHLAALGATFEELDLRGCETLEEALDAVRIEAQGLPPEAWILGSGWDQTRWGGAFPGREALDAASGDHPAFLLRVDHHAAWANSAALRIAGIDGATPDPPGGAILKEAAAPTGILLDTAAEIVEAAVPPPSEDSLPERLEKAMQAVRSAGLSGVTDMKLSRTDLRLIERLDRARGLPLPVEGYLDSPPEPGEGKALFRRGRAFRLAGAKIFVDGALGSRGAALHEPYSDAPETRGILLYDRRELAAVLEGCRREGMPPALHAIGDLAVSLALDAADAAGLAPGFRIEHLQVIRREDRHRLETSGAVASLQPSHLLTDAHWGRLRLGDRFPSAYPLGSLAARGIPILLGTDFPIEPALPCRTLFAALSRTPESERLDPAGAFRAMAPPPWSDAVGARTLAAGDPLLPGSPPDVVLEWRLAARPDRTP